MLEKREKDLKDNNTEAKQRDSKQTVVQPLNRTDLKVGDTVALLSSPSSSRPFYLARILKVTNSTIEIHWYHNTKVDGTYTLEYEKKKGRGVGAPSIGRVYKTRVLDTVLSVTGVRGRLEKEELKRLLGLVKQSRHS